MDQQTQIELLEELLQLHAQKLQFVDENWVTIDTGRYQSAEVFAQEHKHIHRNLPQIAAHVSALPEPGTFKTMNLCGVPLLMTRDDKGRVRAFYNVCRHRGAELVADSAGCKQRFSCPYHAWTYDNSGKLIGVPHEQSGFPGLDRDQHGLRAVPCEEYAGWIWVSLAENAEGVDVVTHLGGLAGDLEAMDAGAYRVLASDTLDISANWKLLVEGGLESYHFRVAHRNTIAPLFLDNLSSYRLFGPHARSILPRTTLMELSGQPQNKWSLGEHSNVLYSLFPGSQFLVQQDHFVWIQGMPLAPDRTRLVLSTMVPERADLPERRQYWMRNHALTIETLTEDFQLAEGIQRGFASGANLHLNFGRYEGALAAFNRAVENAIA